MTADELAKLLLTTIPFRHVAPWPSASIWFYAFVGGVYHGGQSCPHVQHGLDKLTLQKLLALAARRRRRQGLGGTSPKPL